ncbi:hypothetical protein G4B88_003213 [Cannabis sativa]|uniref:Non-reducing end beta-L-arabinofuranosidase-like GH127 catalytic domain-containing protein n=1 Tax=Cannabis sativa TaxID=3483 RepID=A0A7J6I3W7_CANSA|nr:hypothetical protein G4B88_003213 [Cannabis sativa]
MTVKEMQRQTTMKINWSRRGWVATILFSTMALRDGESLVTESQLNVVLAVARFLLKCQDCTDLCPKAVVLEFFRSIQTSFDKSFWLQAFGTDVIASFLAEFLRYICKAAESSLDFATEIDHELIGESGPERSIPGNTLAVQDDMPFSGLTTFRITFLSKFECSQMLHPNFCFYDVEGHFLSATAQIWASTYNDTLERKMSVVVSYLSECQEKLGNGYLFAFPSELFDRFEAIKPVWAPYYTIHKILAGLPDQYTLAGSSSRDKGDDDAPWVLRHRFKNFLIESESFCLLKVLVGGRFSFPMETMAWQRYDYGQRAYKCVKGQQLTHLEIEWQLVGMKEMVQNVEDCWYMKKVAGLCCCSGKRRPVKCSGCCSRLL